MAKKNPHAVALGRKGGQVVTERKREHLRRAAKQPRPGRQKFQAGDRVVAKETAPAAFRAREGTIEGRTHNRAEYYVRFDDRPDEPEAAFSWWLEERAMIDNRRRATCVTCGKGTNVTVHADGFDDAPEAFKVVIECDGRCPKVYLAYTAAAMHERFKLPLTGWSAARY